MKLNPDRFNPDNLDEDLKRALRHEQPPADFAAKVLARAAALDKPVVPVVSRKVVAFPLWRKPAAWAIAAGITITALIPAGVVEYRHRQEQKAAEAGRQLAIALNITRIQLQKTKDKLQKVSKQRAL